MDQGVIVSCKQHYQHKYLDEVLVVIEEEEDMEEDTRGQQTVNNIKSYKIWHLQFHVLERCQSDNSLYAWKKIMMGEDPESDFEGFEPKVFHKVLSYAGEKNVDLNDFRNWLEENDADPSYQVLSMEEIAESVLAGEDSIELQ